MSCGDNQVNPRRPTATCRARQVRHTGQVRYPGGCGFSFGLAEETASRVSRRTRRTPGCRPVSRIPSDGHSREAAVQHIKHRVARHNFAVRGVVGPESLPDLPLLTRPVFRVHPRSRSAILSGALRGARNVVCVTGVRSIRRRSTSSNPLRRHGRLLRDCRQDLSQLSKIDGLDQVVIETRSPRTLPVPILSIPRHGDEHDVLQEP